MEKKRKKAASFDDLAKLIEEKQEETLRFVHENVVEKMATKDDLTRVESRLDELEQDLRAEMKQTRTDIIATVNAIRDVKLENLEKDVEAIKKKIGMVA